MNIYVNLPNGDRAEISARESWTLKDAIRDAQSDIVAQCGGGCACATCHVHVSAGWMDMLAPAGAEELELLADQEEYDPACSRLSCQIICDPRVEGMEVSLMADSWED